MSIARLAPVLALAGLAAIAAAACADERISFQGEETPPFPDAAPAPDVCSGVRCSRDLEKVIDACTDEIVAECSVDQGCGEGACVDACRSAELSKGSTGCAFWTLPPPSEPHLGRGSCFAAMVANTWRRPVTLSAELGADALDISKSVYTAQSTGARTTYTRLEGPLPPGEVALVFLSQMPPPARTEDFVACPSEVVPAYRKDPSHYGTAMSRAFRLKADAPVTAYSIFPYGGASIHVPTATLLLPISSWTTNYVAVSTAGLGPNVHRVLQLVAEEDDTEIWMKPNADIVDGLDVLGTARGVTRSWKLSRGQVLQIAQNDDLTGSPIESSKPVGLFGGAECANIPGAVPSCDLTQQQIPPLSQWGSEYALVPYRPRIGSGVGTDVNTREQIVYSFVAAASGTVLTYDPARPAGAPEKLESGKVTTFMTDALAVVKSQDSDHPFHAAVYMTGETFYGRPGAPSTTGDPDFVNLVPSDQFLDHYVFFADHTYPETTLTLVRRRSAKGFLPVYLGCAGEIADFRPLGSSGEYEFAWVHVTKDFVSQKFTGGECGHGRHEARSDGPFSVTVWGTDIASSYGYAGGMGSRPINTVRPPIIR